MTAGVDYT